MSYDNNLTYAVVIPARYQSSRFPGKPLAQICGKPMIYHVWLRCCEAVGQDKVYVATDDNRIADVVTGFGGQVVKTSSDCLTGTDRIAEANLTLDCDFVINVQGDEPLIEPEYILAIVKQYQFTGNVVNAYCKVDSVEEMASTAVPKVVVSNNGKLLYMSRAAIPCDKAGRADTGYKQVCIYAFSREHLQYFKSFSAKTPLEQVEDIEILRFLESDIMIDMIELPAGSQAVDFPEDIAKVEQIMQRTMTP